MARRRHRLAQRRKAIGLSQEQLAEVMGVDRSTVVRWERADTDPQPWHRPKLARVLRLSIEELAELLTDVADREPVRPPVRTEPGAEPGAGTAAAGGQFDDLAAMRSLRATDSRIGGSYLYATVVSHLQRNIAPRLFGHRPDADEQQVFAAAASMAEMAGWMAHDGGEHRLARQHLRRALGLAQVSHDRHLGAHVLGSLSHLAHHARQPQQAMAYAKQGHDRLAVGTPHRTLAARLLAMQARVYAARQDRARCLGHLHQAEQALGGPPDEPISPWVNPFDEASLAAEAARCLRQLGDLEAARRQAQRVLDLRAPDRIRSRAFAHLVQVGVLIEQGEPEQACEAARSVVRSTRSLGSYLIAQQLERLPPQLAPYHRNREVAAFLEWLHHELRDRRWLARWLPAFQPTGTDSG